LQDLQDKLNAVTPFPSALIDGSGKILTATAWQDVCTKFHRLHPEANKVCVTSDRYIFDHLADANLAVTYQCPHGLVDNAIPIIIEGDHIASFFTGQFFLEPPDIDFFRKQAAHYGFDEDAYLAAVEKVPVWSHSQLNSFLEFFKKFTESLANLGLTRLRELQIIKSSLEKEHRFRSIVENTEAGYFFIDTQGIVRDVNSSWVKLYKYDSPEEIIGHHFTDIQRIGDADQSVDIVNSILSGQPEHMTGEFSRKCKDGSTGWHSFSARPVIREGDVIGIEGFIIDTTHQKMAEMDRDIAQKRLKSVFGKMAEGFALQEIIFDDHGNPVDYRFLDVNPAFEKFTGLKADDIIGKRAYTVLPDLEPVWAERYGNVAITGDPITFEDFAAPQRKHFHVVAFNYAKNQVATIFTDITERKKSEDWLKTLAHAIDSIKECVSMTDNQNVIIFVNKAFCNTYGYSLEELIGQNISMIRSPYENPNKNSEILTNTLDGGWSGEVLNRKKDGTDFPVYISTAIVANGQGRPIALIGIATDITERKRNEQELVDAKERAEESDRLKSAFLANISHEIRTPMNSILGFSDLLEEMLTEPKHLEYLRIISTGGDRLLTIINSVIDIAKIESGQIDLNPSDFDINLLMQELFDLNKRRNLDIKFINDNLSSTPLILNSDKTKLFQILNNLLSNALKFTMKGSVRFGYVTGSGMITFYVKDTGIGIPDEFKEKVFERFRKVDLNERTNFEGTGLGLAITRELVKILGGEIWFDSEHGKGTMFFVKFPM